MAFPNDPLVVTTELQLAGVWTDVSQFVYTREPITITAGRSDEGQRVEPSRCSLTLNNRDGRFSARNPLSPHFGQLGRNTPVRVSVNEGPVYLDVPGGNFDYASTPDHASLDIVGDIDVRIDCSIENLLTATDPLHTIDLLAKLAFASGSKSWLFGIRDERVYFEWSADGSATLSAKSTLSPLVPPSQRIALRATLDVDNGASGRTVRFFTAPTLAGPWTQLGDAVITAGITSIFNSATSVRVGKATDLAFTNPVGRVHAAQIRNGIDGTVVANPDFTIQTPGAASFTDSTGKVWTVNANAVITNRNIRFYGEISAWPARWDVSGKDVFVPVEAAGILRRLDQGNKALESTLRRRLPSFGPLAYWPMEDLEGSTQAASPIAGVAPMRMSRVDWASVDSLASSSPLPALATAGGLAPELRGQVPAPATTQTSWIVSWIYRLDTVNTPLFTFMRILSTGTVAEWYIQINSTTTRVIGRNADGVDVFTQDIDTSGSGLYNQWIQIEFSVEQVGVNVNWHIGFINIGGSAGAFDSSFIGTLGKVTGVSSPPNGYAAALDGMAIGHISVFSPKTTIPYQGAVDAWAGETAGKRMIRLTDEEVIPFLRFGDTSLQERVGAQRPAPVLDLLRDAADVDAGLLYEARGAIALAFRDRNGMYNQPAALALNYAAAGEVAPPLEPVDDDQRVRNDVTVTRAGGSSARVTLDTGPLSTEPPPDGVGRYDESRTLNLFTDGQPAQHAGWLLHLGTWDEARYPRVHVDLSAASHLINAATTVDVRDRITIANLPAWLPPDKVELLVEGYAETIGLYDWDLTFNCTPAGPWEIGIRNDAARGRRDTAGSELAAAATSTGTALQVTTTKGPLWTTAPGDMPIDVVLGGERVTATAITDSGSDAFGRTVSSGWGTADIGGAWTISGGVAADYAVSTGAGRHTLSSVNISRRTTLVAPSADWDVYVDVSTSALATGAPLYAGPMVRVLDTNNLYMARVEFLTTQVIAVSLRKRVGGTETEFGMFTTDLTHVANQAVRVRFQGTGTAMRAKVWAPADREPDRWHLNASDGELTASGGIGCRSIAATGNTNVSPAISYDNFFLVNPQAWTVTRSVNGVVKAHTAGTELNLHRPTVRAL